MEFRITSLVLLIKSVHKKQFYINHASHPNFKIINLSLPIKELSDYDSGITQRLKAALFCFNLKAAP